VVSSRDPLTKALSSGLEGGLGNICVRAEVLHRPTWTYMDLEWSPAAWEKDDANCFDNFPDRNMLDIFQFVNITLT